MMDISLLRRIPIPKLVSLLLFCVALCISCGGKSQVQTVDLSQYKTYDGLSAALEKGENIAVVDVRTPGEFAQGHIPGAVNIPVDQIADRPPDVEKDTVIVLYCLSGGRSGTAFRALKRLEFAHIVNFGAVANWRGTLSTGR